MHFEKVNDEPRENLHRHLISAFIRIYTYFVLHAFIVAFTPEVFRISDDPRCSSFIASGKKLIFLKRFNFVF